MTQLWRVVPLSKIIRELEAGVSVNGLDEPVATDGEVGVLKVSCLSRGRFLPRENKKIVPEDIGRAAVSPRAGDILISRANTLALVGASGYVAEDHPNLFLSDKLWRVHLNDPDTDSARWLIAVLNSTRLRREFYRRATGTSGSMKNIGKEALLSIQVPRPPREIQRKLGSVMECLDKLSQQLDVMVDSKRTIKRALMQQLLAGQKRFPEFRDRPWTFHRFDALCEELSDRNGKQMGADHVMGVIKGVGFEPMRERVRGKGDLARYKIVLPGAFAFNPMRLNIGSIAFNDSGRSILVSPDYVVFRARANVAAPEFINQLRYSAYWTGFMKRAGAGSVRVRIYFSDLARLRVPTPALDEQKRIADALGLVDAEVAQFGELHTLREKQKASLLSRLLNGQLTVRAR